MERSTIEIESCERTIELSPSDDDDGRSFGRSSGDLGFGPLQWNFLFCAVGGHRLIDDAKFSSIFT